MNYSAIKANGDGRFWKGFANKGLGFKYLGVGAANGIASAFGAPILGAGLQSAGNSWIQGGNLNEIVRNGLYGEITDSGNSIYVNILYVHPKS